MATTRRILIAEPSAPLRQALAELLEPALDVVVDQRDGVPEADEVAGYDLVLLDAAAAEAAPARVRALADMPGAPPVVLLGGRAGQDHAALGGRPVAAMAKPLRFAALARRLRELLRRRWDAAGPRLGRFRFDPTAKLLVPDPPAEPVRLTEKEAGILDHLLRHGLVAEREDLLRALWGFAADVTTHTLETHVYRLRQKLEADPSRARILVTEDGGYRLVIDNG